MRRCGTGTATSSSASRTGVAWRSFWWTSSAATSCAGTSRTPGSARSRGRRSRRTPTKWPCSPSRSSTRASRWRTRPVPTYTTPGVHYERVDASAPAIAILRTDVAGFVGLARRGPLDLPVPVQSWRQFQAYFGEVSGAAFLAYAVRAFFENGGRRCWVVRVAAREGAGGAATAGLTLYDVAGAPVWRVSACSPGVWGGDLTVLVREVRRAQT